jgi:hypothetical protein
MMSQRVHAVEAILAGTVQITRKLLESIDIDQAAQQEPASRTASVRRSSTSDSGVTTISWCIFNPLPGLLSSTRCWQTAGPAYLGRPT